MRGPGPAVDPQPLGAAGLVLTCPPLLAQRCNSKCVSEPTFYRLVQSFAVVLFE